MPTDPGRLVVIDRDGRISVASPIVELVVHCTTKLRNGYVGDRLRLEDALRRLAPRLRHSFVHYQAQPRFYAGFRNRNVVHSSIWLGWKLKQQHAGPFLAGSERERSFVRRSVK